jgi:coenzyme F420 hydrogenase subunit beta
MTSYGFDTLKREVIDKGLCHGCGTCVGVCTSGASEISYGLDYDDDPQPRLKGECEECGACYESCPGANVPMPEIDTMVFGRHRNLGTESLGILSECLGGFARDEHLRTIGAGGGATGALLAYALEKGIIDGALISAPDHHKPWRIIPKLISTSHEAHQLSEYSYCLVPVNTLFREASVSGAHTRLALVGLPCHIHGWRKVQLLKKLEPIINSVVLSIGTFCPTNFFWQYTKHVLVEKCGIDDFAEISHITFHGGDTPKHLCVTLANGHQREVDAFTHLLWGLGNFVHQRCSVCTDWSAELADISVGDFWEPWPSPGSPGWSTIISRTRHGDEIVQGAQKEAYLYARPTPEAFLVASYAWEIKKHANAYRLFWRGTRSPNPVPQYGYPLEEILALRDAHTAPWRVNARLHGLLNGVPPEEAH